jgi:hypothetical protein
MLPLLLTTHILASLATGCAVTASVITVSILYKTTLTGRCKMTTVVLNITRDSAYNLLVATARADIPSSAEYVAAAAELFAKIGKFAMFNKIALEQKSFFCPVDYGIAIRSFTKLIQWEQYVDENFKGDPVDFCSPLKIWNIGIYEECMENVYSNKFFKDVNFN